MNNSITDLQERLKARFPDASFHLNAPDRPNGLWILDVESDGHPVEVEWRPQAGFGISSRDAVFGEGPDETAADVDEAFARVRRLILSRTETKPPPEATLGTLRRLRSVSQKDLASRLNVSQAAVSKTERRSDLHVGTLRSFVAALGGDLEFRARFGDEVIEIVFSDPE